jgi:hypothetical protein
MAPKHGRPSAGGIRGAMRILRLLAFGLLVGASGCAVTRTDHQVLRGTPSTQDIPLGPPLLAKTQLVGSTIDVQVAPGQCVLETTTPVVEKDRISRHPSAASTLTFLGFGAGLGGLGYLAWNRADGLPQECPEKMMAEDSCTTQGTQKVLAGLLWAGGAALAGYGVYDLIRGERDVQEKETANRKEVQRAAPRACAAQLANHVVEVRLPDGQVLKAATSSDGAARFQVPESFLQAASSNLRAAVLVDGRAGELADLSALVAAYRRAHPVRLALGGQDSRYLYLADGKFIAASPPAASDSANAPRIQGVRATETLINGGAAFIELQLSDPDGEADVDRVVVVTEGDSGYYVLPSQPGNEQRRVRVGIRDSVTEPRMRLAFALMDRAGHVSDYEFRTFPIVRTGTGDLKVSLTFDRGTDLDLHVVEPSKEAIFFGNRGSSSGGQLDLDSNAGCNIDGVNNENIFWQTGTAPSGEYKIYVHHFKSCVREPTNYFVTVYNGRKVETFEGILGKDERAPRLIATFKRALPP